METPVFEEFDPASDCDCPGCVRRRRFPASSALPGPVGRPAAHRALAIAAAAGAVLVAVPSVPVAAAAHGPARPGDPAGDEPDTPQGGEAPLHGSAGSPAKPGAGVEVPATTRAAIINRAKKWITAQVPYSMSTYWSDGYRQDCSGYVSMAWNLPGNEWTGSLGAYGVRISRDQLQPGDILLFHNPADPQNGSHVVLFGGWTDYTHTYYIAYEQTRPHTRRQSTPYAYWSNSTHYLPYRHKGLADGASGAQPSVPGTKAMPYPGASAFGPGTNNAYVTQLGRLLVERGGRRFYTSGPGPRWSNADRRATQAFQLAQGWKGAGADGLPGPRTWSYLVEGKGRDIPPAAGTAVGTAAGTAAGTAVGTAAGTAAGTAVGTAVSTAGANRAPSAAVPGFPGRGMFRPGAHNAYITLLGKQLVKKGFGAYYTSGPGPDWGESDRRAVEAFQRTQGWRGGAADGYPGAETWRRVFS
ncbi:peptidoglycan-binding protein [Streptomyces sp. NBC_01571]|uniref:peptidoglycan-binding protein n=1 Tax=Streptomyces sp. NBC_01571 TaxID=2975883 RepID=UPI0022560FC6|nr:peptidoglycan-binding protein [Streptomyces sp. NBC_01571]MCX4575194.1 peptidoglycan-binding protein [Streptomyces sp. NBC_01571]